MVASVIVLPAMLLTVWLVLQYAMALHVRHGAQAAAQDAALAAASGIASPGGVATSLMSSIGVAHGVVVQVQTGPDRVIVTVSADVQRIVPIGTFRVVERASAPIERFVAEDARP